MTLLLGAGSSSARRRGDEAPWWGLEVTAAGVRADDADGQALDAESGSGSEGRWTRTTDASVSTEVTPPPPINDPIPPPPPINDGGAGGRGCASKWSSEMWRGASVLGRMITQMAGGTAFIRFCLVFSEIKEI